VRACAALYLLLPGRGRAGAPEAPAIDGLLSTCQQRCQLRLTCTVGVQRSMHASNLLACGGGLGVGSHSVLPACTVSFSTLTSGLQPAVGCIQGFRKLIKLCCSPHTSCRYCQPATNPSSSSSSKAPATPQWLLTCQQSRCSRLLLLVTCEAGCAA
jgi:hypothetical protein